MRKQLVMVNAALTVPVCVILLLGCNGCGDKAKPTTQPAATTESSGTTATKSELASTGWGTALEGTVTLEGEAPAPKQIAMEGLKQVCHDGADEKEKIEQHWLVNPSNKGVANVLVFLKPLDKNNYFKIHSDDKKRGDAHLKQPRCVFNPHVLALYPSYYDGKALVSTGQQLVIHGSPNFEHNAAWDRSGKNEARSIRIGKGGQEKVEFFPHPSPIRVKCDVHKWMSAYVWVFDHPYAAVTDEDGKFKIANVPAGVEVAVCVWHDDESSPRFAANYGGEKGKAMKFEDGKKTSLDIKISAK